MELFDAKSDRVFCYHCEFMTFFANKTATLEMERFERCDKSTIPVRRRALFDDYNKRWLLPYVSDIYEFNFID